MTKKTLRWLWSASGRFCTMRLMFLSATYCTSGSDDSSVTSGGASFSDGEPDQYRIINHTARCVGPRLMVFRREAPANATEAAEDAKLLERTKPMEMRMVTTAMEAATTAMPRRPKDTGKKKLADDDDGDAAVHCDPCPACEKCETPCEDAPDCGGGGGGDSGKNATAAAAAGGAKEGQCAPCDACPACETKSTPCPTHPPCAPKP